MISSAHHEALVRRQNGLQVAMVETQRPGPRDLVIAPSFVGVCGTDLQIVNGSRPDTAEILGHEGYGTVVQAGPRARMDVGERVVFNPAAELHQGLILGHNVPGLFQRYITVASRSVEHGLVLRADPDIPPLCAALVEPLASIVYAHELLARVRTLRSIVIFGAGPIGLLAALYMRSLGIHAVVAHTQQSRLDTAVALGLLEARSAIITDDSLPQALLAANDDKPFDASIIATTRDGAPNALACAVKVVDTEGCIDLVTNYPEQASAPEGVRVTMLRTTRATNVCGIPHEGHYATATVSGRRLRFTGHRGTSARHLTIAQRALCADLARYTKIITHTLTLHDAARAVQALAHSSQRALDGRDCIKAVIDIAGSSVSDPP